VKIVTYINLMPPDVVLDFNYEGHSAPAHFISIQSGNARLTYW